MGVVFALLSAVGYGTSDFTAGLLSRRYAAEPASGLVIAIELLFTGLWVVLFPGHGPTAKALLWGALSGVGGGAGTVALYRGLATGQMSVVATTSGVLAAVVPAVVGLALGEHLGPASAAGIVIAVPAIALVSWAPGGGAGDGRAGLGFGLLAGLAFALLFIGLDRAGTRAGAWPLLPGQTMGLLVASPMALRGLARVGRPHLRDGLLVLIAGVLASAAALLFLAATGRGELSIVAVITSLYPAFTVLMARALLAERWSRLQATGLAVAAASIVLVSLG